MAYPTLRFVFDRKKTATRTKRALIQLEVLHNRKRKWISTGIKVYADQWDDRKMVVNCLESMELNDRLSNMRKGVEEWISQLIRDGEPFSFDSLNDFVRSWNDTEDISYIDYVEQRIRERRDIRDSTKKTQSKFPNSLREFGVIRHFSDLTVQNIKLYDNWLHDKGYTQTTVHSYHKFNKIYINDAIRAGIIENNPYSKVRIERGKSKTRKYLTPEELDLVENAEIPLLTVRKARDLFVFQCYTGLAYADLSRFDFRKVIKKGERYVIYDRRQKTDEDYYIVLLSPAVRILEEYDFVLPKFSNQQYNMRLKIVADYAGLDKPITSHMGRHTFAVIALNNGVKIESVAKMMGHTDISTTQIYAKILNSELEKDFDMLEKRISKL